MFKKYSLRLVFALTAITFVVISPLFAIFVPMTVPDLFLTDRSWFYIYSFKGNVKIILIGFFIIAAGFALLAWKRQGFTYIGCLLFVSIGCATLYSSIGNYTKMNEVEVHKNQLIGSQTLRWADMEQVMLEFVPNDVGQYVFKGKNGEQIIVEEDKQMATSYIYQMANKQNVPYLEYEKK